MSVKGILAAAAVIASLVSAGPQPGCSLPEYCGPSEAATRRADGAVGVPAPEPWAERQAGVLVVGTPAIHQAAPWPAWDRPGKAGGDKVR